MRLDFCAEKTTRIKTVITLLTTNMCKHSIWPILNPASEKLAMQNFQGMWLEPFRGFLCEVVQAAALLGAELVPTPIQKLFISRSAAIWQPNKKHSNFQHSTWNDRVVATTHHVRLWRIFLPFSLFRAFPEIDDDTKRCCIPTPLQLHSTWRKFVPWRWSSPQKRMILSGICWPIHTQIDEVYRVYRL